MRGRMDVDRAHTLGSSLLIGQREQRLDTDPRDEMAVSWDAVGEPINTGSDIGSVRKGGKGGRGERSEPRWEEGEVVREEEKKTCRKFVPSNPRGCVTSGGGTKASWRHCRMSVWRGEAGAALRTALSNWRAGRECLWLQRQLGSVSHKRWLREGRPELHRPRVGGTGLHQPRPCGCDG